MVTWLRERVGEGNTALLFDAYHLGANGVDIIAAAERSAGVGNTLDRSLTVRCHAADRASRYGTD